MAQSGIAARSTVLYDEDCGVCTGLGRWLERRSSGITALPIGSDTGARLLCDLAPAARYAEFHFIDSGGRRTSGAPAVPLVVRRLPGGRFLAPLLELWPSATRLGYGLMARQRHRLSRLLGMRSCSASSPRGGDPE